MEGQKSAIQLIVGGIFAFALIAILFTKHIIEDIQILMESPMIVIIIIAVVVFIIVKLFSALKKAKHIN